MNGVQTRFKCKLDVKRCKRFVFPPSSLLPRSNALKTKAIRYFQTDRTLTRIVSPPLLKAAIAASEGTYNPEAGAYLAMIPAGSAQYNEAQKIYGDYTKHLTITQEQEKTAIREMEMKKMELAAKTSKQMSSSEMRRRIALEDAQTSPFRMLWYKLCYGLGDKVPVNYDPDAGNTTE